MQDYLDRIGYEGPGGITGHDALRSALAAEPGMGLEVVSGLQRSHMTAVPFENIAVFRGEPVSPEVEWSLPKVVERGQGGWCFELNGAFAMLLESLGFSVLRLGAAVLLDGPSTKVDHAALEVGLDEPYLVDVGFGESFIKPLKLNDRGMQDGGIAPFQFFDSAEGLTLTKVVDDVPEPQYRFRRVALTMTDFTAASDHLRTDTTLSWSTKPFATRLIDGGPERVTLLSDRLKFHGAGETREQPVASDEWDDHLQRWFR